MARTDELKAQNYAACLDGANVISTVIATHDKGSEDMTVINAAITAGKSYLAS